MKHNIITLQKKDNLYSVYAKIRKAFPDGEGKVVFLAKSGSPFFSNIYNILLLIHHFPRISFSLVTKDKNCTYHCRKHGVTCYSKLRDVHLPDMTFGQEVLMENFGFWEFLGWLLRRSLLRTKSSWSVGYQRYRQYVSRVRSSLVLVLLLGVIVAILLIGAILLLTLPKTTITVEPALFVKPVQANMVFIEEELTSGTYTYEVPIRRYRYTISYSDTFAVRNYDVSNAGQARGTVRIYNFSPEDVRLRPETRFQTEEGLIYRLQDWALVPTGDISTAYLDVEVIADHYDAQSTFMGTRGNIPSGTFLSLPGLEALGEGDIIRAETMEDFLGGTDDVVPVFDEEQYENFLSLYTQRMELEAEKDILHNIEEVDDGYYVLPIHGITQPVDIKVASDHDPGDVTPEVTFTGVGEFETVTFDLDIAHKHLLEVSSQHIIKDAQQIVSTPDGMVDIIHVFYQETDPYRIKATVQSDVSYKYRLDSPAIRQMFIDDFLTEVLGKKKDEALRTLLNNSMISSAKIRITPFWKDSISYNPQDITFRIQE